LDLKETSVEAAMSSPSSTLKDAAMKEELDEDEMERLAEDSIAQSRFGEYDDEYDNSDDEESPQQGKTSMSKLGVLAVTPVPDDGDHR
jgi:hypothetical protein